MFEVFELRFLWSLIFIYSKEKQYQISEIAATGFDPKFLNKIIFMIEREYVCEYSKAMKTI